MIPMRPLSQFEFETPALDAFKTTTKLQEGSFSDHDFES
jgi:hypothetical protein